MKQKWFEIGNNQITMFPNEIWKIAGFAIAVIFPVFWIAFLIWAHLLQLPSVLFMGAGNLIILLPFFFAGSRQIIIDGTTQTVLRKSWFGIKKICSFSDIAQVQLITVVVYNNRNSGYYKLILKKNPYGRGIQLHMGIDRATKQFASLQNTAIPFIKKLLATYNINTEPDTRNWIETEAAGFKMFRQKDGRFQSKPFKTVNLILAIIMFGIGLSIMIGMVNSSEFKKEYYGLFALMGCIANIGIWGERIVINPSSKTFEKSYIGLFKKNYLYQHIVGFSTLKHVTGFGSNGIDIIIEIKNAATVQQVTLFSKVSSKKIPALMEELKRILAIGINLR